MPALAAVALARAFGNQFKASAAGKAGFSPKAGRLLAAQLGKKPRDFGTDSRLVAALAAEHVGAAGTGLAALRLAVLRRYLEGADKPPAPARRSAGKGAIDEAAHGRARAANRRHRPWDGRISPASPGRCAATPATRRRAGRATARPTSATCGTRCARGGPSGALSEIEFKCMLTEAHRAGSLALANADLKDNNSIKDLQDSAVVYKNAVFHFIRVDG